MPWRSAFPLLPTLLLLAACGVPGAISDPTATSPPVAVSTLTPAPGGIEGQVLIGPNCPVVQVNSPCPDQPYQATISVLDQNGSEVMQFQSDGQGLFRVSLVPGAYTLVPLSPNALPYAQEQTVMVVSGQFTQVTITYDSGIR